ncbi:MAG: hypothetical protein JWO94_2131 [Verrucomicrobiaceae bacterium]|nr:hypothetical protein [Verrucomicrobiaceae bacterium]
MVSGQEGELTFPGKKISHRREPDDVAHQACGQEPGKDAREHGSKNDYSSLIFVVPFA